MKNQVLITAVVAVAVGVAAFFIGMKYQLAQGIPAGSTQQGQSRVRGAGGNGGNGNRPVMGTILNADDKSVTVKLMDGSTKLVLLSSTTTLSTATSAAVSDLKVGLPIGVFGQANSDGSVTAQSIQLRPMFMRQPGPADQQPGN